MKLRRYLCLCAVLTVNPLVADDDKPSANDRTIQPLIRVLCLKKTPIFPSCNELPKRDAIFGELFKVAKVEGNRCLVFNDRTDGWIDQDALENVGRAELKERIANDTAASEAEKQYAMGNYSLRRNRSLAAEYFSRACQLDPKHSLACFELARSRLELGETKKLVDTLQKLKRLNEAFAVGIELQLRPNDEKLLAQARPLAGESIFLTSVYSTTLIRSSNEWMIHRGFSVANELVKMSPHNPASFYVLAVAHQIGSEHVEGELSQRMHQQALAATIEAMKRDITYWKASQQLAKVIWSGGQGDAGKSIASAISALRFNPVARDSIRFISQFHERSVRGERFVNGAGETISPNMIQTMQGVEIGLKRTQQLDLPWIVDLGQLHGWLPIPSSQLRDEHGLTALHILVHERNALCLNYLAASCKLDWTITDRRGLTPMHTAVEIGSAGVVDALLIGRVSCEVKTPTGPTAISYAVDRGQHGLVLRMMRDPSCSKTSINALRSSYGVEAEHSVEQLRKVVRSRFEETLIRPAIRDIKRMVQQYKDKSNQLREAQIGNKPEPLFRRRPAMPLPVPPPGIALDRQTNPAHARARTLRRLARQVDEIIENEQDQTANLPEEAIKLKQELKQLRETITRFADVFVQHCRYCFSADEYKRFEQDVIEPLRAHVNAHHISWT